MMNTRTFLTKILTCAALGAFAFSSQASDLNPRLIEMEIVSKTKKAGSNNIYHYVLQAKVNTLHDSVESKLGGVGAVPKFVGNATYRVAYDSPPGKTWMFKAKLRGTRVAERSRIVY